MIHIPAVSTITITAKIVSHPDVTRLTKLSLCWVEISSVFFVGPRHEAQNRYETTVKMQLKGTIRDRKYWVMREVHEIFSTYLLMYKYLST
jgi:hypothetical protein